MNTNGNNQEYLSKSSSPHGWPFEYSETHAGDLEETLIQRSMNITSYRKKRSGWPWLGVVSPNWDDFKHDFAKVFSRCPWCTEQNQMILTIIERIQLHTLYIVIDKLTEKKLSGLNMFWLQEYQANIDIEWGDAKGRHYGKSSQELIDRPHSRLETTKNDPCTPTRFKMSEDSDPIFGRLQPLQ